MHVRTVVVLFRVFLYLVGLALSGVLGFVDVHSCCMIYQVLLVYLPDLLHGLLLGSVRCLTDFLSKLQ